MKRYVVLAASLSVLGFASAHAQTFPSPTQDNSARITQTGNRNQAIIDQALIGDLNGQNQAVITQSLNDNRATIEQSNATSPMPPLRFANIARVTQTRSRNDAAIEQIHDYFRVNRNLATIVQRGTDGVASIMQRGDRNEANITQLNTSIDPVSRIQQNGQLNTAVIQQFEGASGEVVIVQGFFGNGTIPSPRAENSTVNVAQRGVNADIFVKQIGIGHVASVTEFGLNGMVDVQMDGDLNLADIKQFSQNGRIIVFSGDNSLSNVANVTQGAGDDGSITFVDQFGTNAVSTIEQDGGGGNADGNYAFTTQTGIGLGANSVISTVLQDGTANEARVTQASSYADSFVSQLGAGHNAIVAQ